jgi:hypothetical protein
VGGIDRKRKRKIFYHGKVFEAVKNKILGG